MYAIQTLGWKDAINQEIDTIQKNKTQKLINLFKGQISISTKQIFKAKLGLDCTMRV